MIDKKLLALLGANKKYIYYTAALMILGLFANLSITAAICRTIELAVNFQQYETARVFLLPAAIAAAGAAVRYAASRGAGELHDTLGRRAKKELRERVYGKIVRLGVRSADGMSMAGLTQVAMEGVEQLDLYYSSYIPQFFYAMAAPVILFCVTSPVDWRTALVLLACVPLIPLSIIAVSKYAKKIFAKYWANIPPWATPFSTACRGCGSSKFSAPTPRGRKR